MISKERKLVESKQYLEKKLDNKYKNTIKYALFGTLFGFMFPIFASILDCLINFGNININSILLLQVKQPLHWVIDLAPPVLGFAAALLGKKYDELENTLKELKNITISKNDLELEINQRIIVEKSLKHASDQALESRSLIEKQIKQIKEKHNETELAKIELENSKQYIQSRQNYLHHEIERLLQITNAVSDGNLTVSISSQNNDEMSNLINGVSQMIIKLREIVSEVKKSSNSLFSKSEKISDLSDKLVIDSQEQLLHTEEISFSIDKISETINKTAENTESAFVMSDKVYESIDHGIKLSKNISQRMKRILDIVNQSTDTINQLGKSTQNIGEIISVIKGIADQTNLLALNATIEAARAGDAGKGFAVVASEIRKLAESTAQATKTISVSINSIKKDTNKAIDNMKIGTEEVKTGVEFTNNSESIFEGGLDTIYQLKNFIGLLKDLSKEQTMIINEINSKIVLINDLNSDSFTSINQSFTLNKELNLVSDDLNKIIKIFDTDIS